MRQYRVDLHIHTCLSPCGSLEMSPRLIVEKALSQGLDAIAITDHNSTLQCPEIQRVGEEAGLVVFAGAEVTTREEAHCIALFETDEARAAFQRYLEAHLPPVPNDPERFGDQVFVNSRDEIIGEVPYLLLSALDQSVEKVSAEVRQSGGLFIAAHVERPSFSLISQLGFIDPALSLDAIEFNHPERYAKLLNNHAYLRNYVQYIASDAHYPDQIGSKYSYWQTDSLSFDSLRKTIKRKGEYRLFAP